jgi:hypothetical protein
MALAPLPEDNTIRYWLNYSVGPFDHSFQVRVADGETDSAVIDAIDEFLALQGDLAYEASIIGLEKAAKGSNVRNPVEWTGNPTFGTGTAVIGAQASFYSFTGRSTDGRKNRLFLFEWKQSFPASFRVQASGDADVAAVVAFLQTQTSRFTTISGQRTLWNAYCNVSVHDHFVDEARG